MRWVPIVALMLAAVPAEAQVWDMNSKCEESCRVALDKCAAVSNKIMGTELKQAQPYNIGTPEREKADAKFESAFQEGEKCWKGYYRCTAHCRAPKACVDKCQAAFRQCFATGERLIKEGLREIRRFEFGSPEWKAAYAKGDAETDHCLEDDRKCIGNCANP